MSNGMRIHSSNSRGYTLIEAAVAFALAAILFAALIAVIAPAYRMFERTRAHADAQLIAGNVLDTIRTTAMNASELTADGGVVNVGRRNTFSVSSGRLVYNGKAVYDEKYYDGKTIAMTAEQAGENIVRVTIEVTGGEMLPASATAIIAPIRRVLDRRGNAQAESALNSGKQTVHANPTGSADALYNDMYIKEDGGNAGFEPTSVFDILKKTKLEALLAEAERTGTAEEKAFFSELLTKTFYLAVYFAEHTRQPVAYLTDVASAEHNAHNNVYFVYQNGNWYMRNPNLLGPDTMDVFNDLSERQLANYLNAGTAYILAENVRLPLPR